MFSRMAYCPYSAVHTYVCLPGHGLGDTRTHTSRGCWSGAPPGGCSCCGCLRLLLPLLDVLPVLPGDAQLRALLLLRAAAAGCGGTIGGSGAGCGCCSRCCRCALRLLPNRGRLQQHMPLVSMFCTCSRASSDKGAKQQSNRPGVTAVASHEAHDPPGCCWGMLLLPAQRRW